MGEILGGINGEVTAFAYLLAWIGLVGSAVGLTLPKDIAMDENTLILSST